jgi:hypothetical protein
MSDVTKVEFVGVDRPEDGEQTVTLSRGTRVMRRAPGKIMRPEDARRFLESRIFLQPLTDANEPPQATRWFRSGVDDGGWRTWLDSPLVVGLLLVLLPPSGLAVLWSSRRYSRDARAALTLSSLFLLALGAVVYISAR